MHKWRPVMFCLTVDDFGIEYVGKNHAQHLLATLQEHYTLTIDWEGKKCAGIYLEWDYKSRTFRLTMENYIRKSFSDIAIQRHANPSNHPTSIVRSYTGQASKIH